MRKVLLFVVLVLSIISCNQSKSSPNKKEKKQINLLTDINPISKDGTVNAVIEIPAGTTEKWEVNKQNGTLKQDYKNGKPRIINYLAYPANYGMIPQTLLPKELGGDGDPLDIIVLGESVAQGSVVNSKLIGVLRLLDGGEQDDKLIAVSESSSLFHINSIQELQNEYNGITDIIELWFTNYKGKDILKSNGFADKNTAEEILKVSIEQYKLKMKDRD